MGWRMSSWCLEFQVALRKCPSSLSTFGFFEDENRENLRKRHSGERRTHRKWRWARKSGVKVSPPQCLGILWFYEASYLESWSQRPLFLLSFYTVLSIPLWGQLVTSPNLPWFNLDSLENTLFLCRYVRPGGGYVPNFQLFEKGDVNGENEQKIFSFLKVGKQTA